MISKNVIWEGEDKLDLDTGFFTRKVFNIGSEECSLYEDTVTKLVKDTKINEQDKTWYLTTITLPGGVLFPDGTPDNYHWLVAPVVDLEPGSKYPVKGKEDEFYETRVAIEDAKKFDHFKEALVYLGML